MAHRVLRVRGPQAAGHGGQPHPALIAAAAVLAALFTGVLMAASVPKGLGFVLALVYVPLVLVNLPLGLCLWVTITFAQHLPAVSVAPNAAGLLVAVGWLGTLISRRAAIHEVLDAHRRLMMVGLLFFVWMALSPAVATVPSAAYDDVGLWFSALLTLVIVATTISRPSHVRMVFAAFVVGGVVVVAAGIPGGGLTANPTVLESASLTDGRFQGGGGDPNYLAAGLVMAITLGVALIGLMRDPIVRWSLVCATGLMAIGLAASQSRGGVIAAVVATAVAFALAKRKAAAVAGVALVALVAGAFFASSPGALSRVTDYQGGGTGRTELWGVAWRIFETHPLTGSGLDSFRSESYRYVRQFNNLKYVRLIAERPDHVHNSYLEMLAETGIVGLVLYLAVIASCLRAGWQAMRLFDALGDRPMSTAARAMLVAAAGTLTASFFLSNGTDLRTWALLGLGPALLAIARRTSNERPAPVPEASV